MKRLAGDDELGSGDFSTLLESLMAQSPDNYPPFDRVPCSNADCSIRWGCPNGGKLVCGRCQLVRYCSKECQKKHWRRHKIDCNDAVRSENWSPGWVIENRAPILTRSNEGSSDAQKAGKEFGLGMNLAGIRWGKIPAMDLLNLPGNEGCSNQDLSLACIVSGDLRNVICTINELPSDYSGEIHVLLNDPEPVVVARNMMLLLILGRTADKVKAVEYALHAFYSAFMPTTYAIYVRLALRPFLDSCFLGGLKTDAEGNSVFSSPLGPTSNFSGATPFNVIQWLFRMVNSKLDAAVEWHRIQYTPLRHDLHHLRYSRMEPSHRLAFLTYRTSGLVFPFGAPKDHFKHGNQYLFSPEGEWFGDDLSNPLDSWDIAAVIQAGKAHGAQRADLYGCLYFYLSEQLRTFAERLHSFRINFRFFATEPGLLAEKIRKDALASYGFPAGITFDRIDVSDLSEGTKNNKIRDILTDWGPMLKDNKHATLLAAFTGWHRTDTSASESNEERKSELISMLIKDGRIPKPSNSASMAEVSRIAGLLVGYSDACAVYYDNSKDFKAYLNSQGMTDDLLNQIRVRPKETHTIIPQRLCVPRNSPADALPSFPDKESWYLNVCVGGSNWYERFVEFSRP